VPEFCDCVESWSLHGLGSAFVVHIETEVSGPPYTDYFVCKTRYKATQLAEHRTQLDAEVDLEWRRSTMLKSRIEQTTTAEFRHVFDAQFLPLATRILVRTQPAESVSAKETAGQTSGLCADDDSGIAASTKPLLCGDESPWAARMMGRAWTQVGKWCNLRRGLETGSVTLVFPIGFLFLGFTACILLMAILASLFRLEALLVRLLEAQQPAQNSAPCTGLDTVCPGG